VDNFASEKLQRLLVEDLLILGLLVTSQTFLAAANVAALFETALKKPPLVPDVPA